MVIPLTDTVAFVYPLTPHGSSCRLRLPAGMPRQRGALPFHHRGAGRRHGHAVAAVTVL